MRHTDRVHSIQAMTTTVWPIRYSGGPKDRAIDSAKFPKPLVPKVEVERTRASRRSPQCGTWRITD